MKKFLLLFFGLFLAIIAIFFTWRYIGYVRDKDANKTFLLPRLEFSMIEINSLTKEKTKMTSKLLIKNQLPFSFTIDSLQYGFFIEGNEVMKDTYKKSLVLKGNDSSWITMPVTIYNQELIAILKKSKEKKLDSVEYRMQASFYSDIPFRKKFNIDIKRMLPLIFIPEVNIEHIKIDSLNFSRAVIQLSTKIKNPNVFSLKAKNITYEFSIEDNEWVKGTIPGLTDIKATNETELKIPVKLSFKEVTKTLYDLLRKGKNVNYKLHLILQIESDINMVKNSKVILESSGSVKSILNFVKD